MSLGKRPTQYKGVLPKNPPNVIQASRAPVDGTDKAFVQGDIWLDTENLASYQFVAEDATWIALGTGAEGGVVTLTGDSGGPIAPVAGNIDILGTAADGIVVTGTTETLTISASQASVTQRGTVELATNAEAVTGTDTDRAVTPAALTARLAAPGAIGGTTPAAGTFTNLTVNDVFAMDGGAVTDNIGQVTLALGTATVLNTSITANDKVFCQRGDIGASTELGVLCVTINAGVSFVIDSRDPADAGVEENDVSVVDYIIVRQV